MEYDDGDKEDLYPQDVMPLILDEPQAAPASGPVGGEGIPFYDQVKRVSEGIVQQVMRIRPRL